MLASLTTEGASRTVGASTACRDGEATRNVAIEDCMPARLEPPELSTPSGGPSNDVCEPCEPGGAILTESRLAERLEAALACPEEDLAGLTGGLPAENAGDLKEVVGEVVDLTGVGVLRDTEPAASGLEALTTFLGGPTKSLCGALGEHHGEAVGVTCARAEKEPSAPNWTAGPRPTVQLVMKY